MTSYRLPAPEDFEATIKDGQASLFILSNQQGMHVALTNYGARIVGLLVPDQQGNPVDVVLGFNRIADYLSADEQYHGASIGRFANRIAQGSFKINETVYHISPNNGPNALHGGKSGFHTRLWQVLVQNQKQVSFQYRSPDGEEGFPGNLNVTVHYELMETNELHIRFEAQGDADTIINLTNHAYFNLNGEGSGEVLDHLIQIHAAAFVPIDASQIPTGSLCPVIDTPFDFRQPTLLSTKIDAEHEQLQRGDGYDHTFVLKQSESGVPQLGATAFSQQTGIQLDVLTTEPGVQFYTGNALSGKDVGKSGARYFRRGAFCFEAQHFPDSPNHPTFPSTVLKAHEPFHNQIIYRFQIVK